MEGVLCREAYQRKPILSVKYGASPDWSAPSRFCRYLRPWKELLAERHTAKRRTVFEHIMLAKHNSLPKFVLTQFYCIYNMVKLFFILHIEKKRMRFHLVLDRVEQPNILEEYSLTRARRAEPATPITSDTCHFVYDDKFGDFYF